MKQIIFLLLVLSATTSFARDCIEALWSSNIIFSINTTNKAYPDSLYQTIDEVKQEIKYHWSNGVLDSAISIQDDTLYSKIIYTTVLSGDTVKLIAKGNINEIGELQISQDYATKDQRHSIVEISSIIVTTDMYLKNDSLISTSTTINGSDTLVISIIYTKSAEDSLKCLAIVDAEGRDSMELNFEYSDTEKGFVEKSDVIQNGEIQQHIEMYFIDPTKSSKGTTSVKRRKIRTQISPKAKYYDLLGRYKFKR